MDAQVYPVYSATMPLLTALPALQDNYIWTLTGTNHGAVIVDPGEAAPVLRAIAAGLRPCAILLTHHHLDHIGGAAELAERHKLPVYAPDDPRIRCADIRVADGDEVTLDASGLRFRVLQVPGHTTSHVAYVGEGVAFTGDTLFSLGCGRLFEGTPAQMLASLQRLAALPAQTLVCCGHEYTVANGAFAKVVDPANAALDARIDEARAQRVAGRPSLPTTMASERATNPFLRCDDPQVAAQVAAHWGTPVADELTTFAALRRWKDGFVAV